MQYNEMKRKKQKYRLRNENCRLISGKDISNFNKCMESRIFVVNY